MAEQDGKPANAHLGVEIAFSITGPLRLPAQARGLWVVDSIVDGVGTPAIAGPSGGSGNRPSGGSGSLVDTNSVLHVPS